MTPSSARSEETDARLEEGGPTRNAQTRPAVDESVRPDGPDGRRRIMGGEVQFHLVQGESLCS